MPIFWADIRFDSALGKMNNIKFNVIEPVALQFDTWGRYDGWILLGSGIIQIMGFVLRSSIASLFRCAAF